MADYLISIYRDGHGLVAREVCAIWGSETIQDLTRCEVISEHAKHGDRVEARKLADKKHVSYIVSSAFGETP